MNSVFHRQTAPVLKPRNVLFLNFHDPAVRIQSLDVEQGRYRLHAAATADRVLRLDHGKLRGR